MPDVVEGLRSFLIWLLSLRWLAWRGRDLAVPVAIVLVVVQWSSWAPVSVGGLPLGVEVVALVVAVLSGREMAIRTIGHGAGAISVAAAPVVAFALMAAAAEWWGAVPWPVVGVAAIAISAAYLAGVFVGADGRRSLLQVALISQVVSIWVLHDVAQWGDLRLNDLHVYLDSAQRWANGGAAYMPAPLHAFPVDPANDFALYPPPFLPFFAALTHVPLSVVEPAWVVFLFACGFVALQALGLRTSWSVLLLAFPPLATGVASGNMTNLGFLAFALAGRAAGVLPLGALVKLQSAVPSLWLVRGRRWKALAGGVAAVAVVSLVTFPIVETAAWADWWAGLWNRADSAAFIPVLFGQSYAKSLSMPAFLVLAAGAIALALVPSGRRGLAALGLASIAASPIVWPHSFLFELPAVLFVPSGALLWLLLGAESFTAHVWGAFYVGIAAVFVAGRVLPAADDLLHPLPGGPWPDLAVRESERGLGFRGIRVEQAVSADGADETSVTEPDAGRVGR